MKKGKAVYSSTLVKEKSGVAPRGERLADYITKVRALRGFSKAELARKAKLHFSSLSRIGKGETEGKKMRLAVQRNLAAALKIPVEYIQAACRGEEIDTEQTTNVCPSCWVPGTSPDIRWSMPDARYCLRCGSMLSNRCGSCSRP